MDYNNFRRIKWFKKKQIFSSESYEFIKIMLI